MREWLLLHKRMFYSICAMTFLILILIRYYAIPDKMPNGDVDVVKTLQSISDNALASIMISGALAILLWWTRPPIREALSESYLQPFEIDACLRTAAKNTREWAYLGHTARYVRSQILPEISKNSQRENEHKLIRIITLNPENTDCCAYYAMYRNACRSAGMAVDSWNTETVQSELIATIITLISLSKNTLIDIEAGFIDFTSLFRADLSSSMVLITQEDNQEPAIRYGSDTHFYKCYRREIEMAWKQCKKLSIKKGSDPLLSMKETDVVAALNAAGINTTLFNKVVINDAIGRATKNESPYVK